MVLFPERWSQWSDARPGSPRVLYTYCTMVHDFKLSPPIIYPARDCQGIPTFTGYQDMGFCYFGNARSYPLQNSVSQYCSERRPALLAVLSSSNILGRCFPSARGLCLRSRWSSFEDGFTACKSLDFPSLPWTPCYCLRPALVRRRSRWLRKVQHLPPGAVIWSGETPQMFGCLSPRFLRMRMLPNGISMGAPYLSSPGAATP